MLPMCTCFVLKFLRKSPSKKFKADWTQTTLLSKSEHLSCFYVPLCHLCNAATANKSKLERNQNKKSNALLQADQNVKEKAKSALSLPKKKKQAAFVLVW